MSGERWNVIVVVLDDIPPAMIDRMPYLASRPHGNWVTLPNWVLSVPWCGPSRAGILTGQFSTQNHVAHNESGNIPDERATWPFILSRHGYRTGLFGKYLNGYPQWAPSQAHVPPGWAEWMGFADQQLYYDQKIVRGRDRQRIQTTEYTTDMTAAQTAAFVASAAEPFCAYWSPVAPHSPTGAEIMVAPRHQDLYAGETPVHTPNFNPASLDGKPQWMLDRFPTQRDTATVEAMDALRVNRWRALAAVDEGLEQIFDEVTTRGLWDRTAVVVLGDNGNADGEWRVDDGKVMPYQICIDAQAMVRWPGATQRTEDALVSTVDLGPTLCAIAGARMPTAVGMDLAPLLDGRRSGYGWRRDIYTEYQPQADTDSVQTGALWITGWRAVVHRGELGHLKWVEYDTAETELYDLAADPYEMSNLASTETELAAAMAARLAAIAP